MGEGRGEGGGGRGLFGLLALVVCPLNTHPFRDEALFLLVLEIRSTFGRSFTGFGVGRGIIFFVYMFFVCR